MYKRAAAAVILLICLTVSGCGRTLEILGDLADISMADTGKEEKISEKDDADKVSPRITVAPEPQTEETETPETTPVPAEEPGKMVTCISPVNVRDAGTMDSRVIGSLSAGDQVEWLGQEGGWVKIRFQGQEAYVYEDYVSQAEEEE